MVSCRFGAGRHERVKWLGFAGRICGWALSVRLMVSSPHEAHHRIFQKNPGLFTSAFRTLG